MRQIALVALVVFLGACSSQAGPSTSAFKGPFLPTVTHSRSWINKEATSGAPLLYVSSTPECGWCVLVFREDTGALVEVINWNLVDPQGIATDKSGNLYVTSSDLSNAQVWIFPPGELAPSKGLLDPEEPTDVVVADDGTVYVSDSGPTASVMVYSSGSNVPTSELMDVRAVVGYGIALDAHDNIYWGISTASGYRIDKFSHGSVIPVDLGITLSDRPQSIAFAAGGSLVVSQPDVPTIDIYRLPNTLVGEFGQTGSPLDFAFNRFGSVFVADGSKDQVEQYKYPSGGLVKTFSAPNFNPIGVAVFPKP
jgi:hypothetical protein